MEYWFIYLLQVCDRIDSLNGCLWIFIVITGVAYICLFVLVETEECAENIKNIRDLTKKLFVCFLLMNLIAMLIPTKNTLLLIGGTYLGKKAVNSVITDEKIKKIDTIINLELDKRIKELKEGK